MKTMNISICSRISDGLRRRSGRCEPRGYRLSREYAVDPLEILFVREVMRTNVAAIPARLTGRELAHLLHTDHTDRKSVV